MIDPITAIGAATSAYKTVVAMVNAGRELEDTLGALGKWYGAASDFSKAEQDIKNPPLFKKIAFSKSVEQEAMDILIHRKKLQEQEMELRSLITLRFGLNAWKELIEMRRQIRKDREQTIYKQMRRRRAFLEGIAVIGLIIVTFGILGGMTWLITTKGGTV